MVRRRDERALFGFFLLALLWRVLFQLLTRAGSVVAEDGISKTLPSIQAAVLFEQILLFSLYPTVKLTNTRISSSPTCAHQTLVYENERNLL